MLPFDKSRSGLPACIDIYRAWLSVRCFGRVEVRTWQERGRELDDRPRRRERTALYFSRPDDIHRISGKLRICGAESETAGDARKTVRLTEETPNLLIKEKIKMLTQSLRARRTADTPTTTGITPRQRTTAFWRTRPASCAARKSRTPAPSSGSTPTGTESRRMRRRS